MEEKKINDYKEIANLLVQWSGSKANFYKILRVSTFFNDYKNISNLSANSK